jgi:hypothetical protein
MKIRTRRAVSLGELAGFVAAMLLAIAAPGWAQMRGGGSAAHVGGHVNGGRPISHPSGRVATPVNPNFTPIRGVSSIGFDREHLIAAGGSTGRRGEDRGRRSFITPIFGYGLPYYYSFDTGYPYDYSVPNDQPQAPPLAPAIPDASEPSYVEPQASAEPVQPPIPPPELGQLILVRRDGQVVMAVAFTTSAGRLTYITKDGLRRSFPIAELDPDATRQMNSVNGTSVALPN